MRVAAFAELTGPDGVVVEERPDPDPGPGEVVVEIEACAINRHDLWILDGDSAMVETDDLPFVSGLDVAGTVRSTGAGTDWEPGDRVVLCPNETCGSCRFCREGPENRCAEYSLFHGGLAERALVPADRLVALPADVGASAAAALPTAYMTAWHMLRRAEVTAGDLVFVPGATGGVGVATVQLLDVLGATSIATSTSASKLERVAALGADHTIESGETAEIERAVGDIGRPDAVVNHLGGGGFTRMGLRTLRRGGRMVVCGRTAGNVAEVDVAGLFLGHTELLGSTMGTQGDLERLVDMVARGAFEPVVDRTYPLDATGEAFADMKARDAVGKLLVTP